MPECVPKFLRPMKKKEEEEEGGKFKGLKPNHTPSKLKKKRKFLSHTMN